MKAKYKSNAQRQQALKKLEMQSINMKKNMTMRILLISTKTSH